MSEEKGLALAYVEKGLSQEEAGELSAWVEAGKPGLSQAKSENFLTLYLMGYSCKEISQMFPGYSHALVLWARVNYRWDEAKINYISEVQKRAVEAALTAKAESVAFLSEILKATHVRWRKEVMEYVADPDNEKPPEVVPKSLHSYGQLTKLIQDLVQPPQQPGGKHPPSDVSPLVSVNINTASKKPDVVVSSEPAKTSIRDRILKRAKKDE